MRRPVKIEGVIRWIFS